MGTWIDFILKIIPNVQSLRIACHIIQISAVLHVPPSKSQNFCKVTCFPCDAVKFSVKYSTKKQMIILTGIVGGSIEHKTQ